MTETAASTLKAFQRWRPLLDGLAGDIHPERWAAAGVGAMAAAKLSGNARARRLLSLRLDWLNGRTEAQGAPAWPDWTEWKVPAALFSGADLVRYGLRLGSALYRADIARLLLKRDVAAFKTAVGEDAYFFALRQAELVKEAAGLSRERVGGNDLAERLRIGGELALAAWLDGLPGDLADRVALKLPPAIDAAGSVVGAWPAEERRLWAAAMARVFSLTRNEE